MASQCRKDLGLLALRLGAGSVLFAHGAQKLFGWFGGGGLDATAGAMEHMGFRPGRPAALAAGLGEAGGGALLALGLATPAAGAAAAGAMAGAVAVHVPAGFLAMSGGFEYPALIGWTAASLGLAGPGRISAGPRHRALPGPPLGDRRRLHRRGGGAAAVVSARARALAAPAAGSRPRSPTVPRRTADAVVPCGYRRRTSPGTGLGHAGRGGPARMTGHRRGGRARGRARRGSTDDGDGRAAGAYPVRVAMGTGPGRRGRGRPARAGLPRAVPVVAGLRRPRAVDAAHPLRADRAPGRAGRLAGRGRLHDRRAPLADPEPQRLHRGPRPAAGRAVGALGLAGAAAARPGRAPASPPRPSWCPAAG